MTNKILTYEEAEEKGLECYQYEDGNYEYKPEGGQLIKVKNDASNYDTKRI